MFWKKKKARKRSTPLNLNYTESGSSSSQTPLTQYTAFNIPALFQCVTLVASDTARCPFDIFLKDSQRYEVASEHRAHQAIRYKWNEALEAYLGWRRLMVHALIWGRGYAWIRQPDNAPIELYNLLPEATTYDVHRDQYQVRFSDDAEGRIQYLYPSEVLVVEGIQWDNSNFLATIEHARDSWQAALGSIDYKNRFYSQGMITGGSVEIPADVSEESADNIEAGFFERHNNANHWFRMTILRDGAQYKPSTFRPSDYDLSGWSENDAREICRWFNIPPSKIGVQDSTSYGSKTEDNQTYADSLGPWFAAISAQCWLKLLTAQEQLSEMYHFKHDIRALFATNPRVLAEVGEIENRNGFRTVNEYRTQPGVGLPPVPGGDVRQFPLNTLIVHPDGTFENPNQQSEPSDSGSEPSDSGSEPSEPPQEMNGHAFSRQ